jgi:hypothetical protein
MYNYSQHVAWDILGLTAKDMADSIKGHIEGRQGGD